VRALRQDASALPSNLGKYYVVTSTLVSLAIAEIAFFGATAPEEV
jgi:hypothetical protein